MRKVITKNRRHLIRTLFAHGAAASLLVLTLCTSKLTASRALFDHAAPTTSCDPGWRPGAPVNGVDGSVMAAAVDSAGNVYVGGSVRAAGNVLVNRIAKWDGASWSPLGVGVDGMVTAIAISGTDVYVGGYFSMAGGIAANRVAKWDGFTWSAVGTGPGHTVEDMAISGSILYAVGTTGSPDHLGIASFWNGATWSALGSTFQGGLSDIAVSGVDVYVSRDYNSGVYRWNGSAWINISTGLVEVRPFDLAASGSNLYLAGHQYLGPTQGEAGYVARWNGSTWTTIASGAVYRSGRWGYVYGIAANGPDVYVTGLFSNIGGASAPGIAKWDGASWSALGDWEQIGYNNVIVASGNNVYFGGRFVSNGRRDRRAEGVAKWNGSTWSDLGDGIYTVPPHNVIYVTDEFAP